MTPAFQAFSQGRLARDPRRERSVQTGRSWPIPSLALLPPAPMTDAVPHDARWFSLRDPVDQRSRRGGFASLLAKEGPRRGWSRVLELDAGQGGNFRYLAPRLTWAREWTLLSPDPGLLEGVAGPEVHAVEGQLREVGLPLVASAHLVTASRLLDRLPRDVLEALVEACVSAGCGVLLALTPDGLLRFEGSTHGDDELVAEAVNRHRTANRGMGRALGVEAHRAASEAFLAAGFECHTSASPWRLGSGDEPVARALLERWAGAALEIHRSQPDRIRKWLTRRTADLEKGRLEITVGHQDLLALPVER